MKRYLLLAALALAACNELIPGTCNTDSDCTILPGAICTSGICVRPEDAGSPDDGGDASMDAGAADANEADAGGDAGVPDGSPNVADGGSSDGSTVPVIASFIAEPRSTITRGETATLKWDVSGATSLSIDTGIGSVVGRALDVTPANTTTYTLTATNGLGSVTATAKVTVVDPASITSFAAAPATITAGGNSTLSWAAANAASLSIDNGLGTVTGTSVSVHPANTTAYTLTATNVAGTSVTAKTTVTVVGTVGITSFTATPAIITQGQSTTLAWTLSGATSASIDQGVGAVSGSNVTVSPTSDTTYTLTASNAAGSTTTDKVTVRVVSPPKIASFSANPSIIASGKTSTLSWSAAGAASLSIDKGIGAVTGTSVAVNPTVTTTYTLKATNAAGATDSATATVTLDSTPPTVTIDSPATNATCGATCTGAVFNLASPANVVFQGKAQDANGLASSDGLVATLDGQPAAVFTSGSNWQFTWQNLPAENGKFHAFSVVATDAAGNKATASRTVYVDRVAPTCSGTQDGKRLISRTATLLQCSEPMDIASIQASFGVAPTASGLTSSDAVNFAFSNASSLQPYQSYTSTLASTAKDRAGNSLAAALSQRFLTEPIYPPSQSTLATGAFYSGWGYRRLALDGDGLPFITVTLGTRESGLISQAYHWDGKGSWQTSPLAMYKKPPCTESCGYFVTADIRASSSVRDDLSLANDYELLMAEDYAGGAINASTYIHSTDFSNWRGLTGASPSPINVNYIYWQGASFLQEYSGSFSSTSILSMNWLGYDLPPVSQLQIIRKSESGQGWQTPTNISAQGRSLRHSGIILATEANEFHAIPSDTVLPFKFTSAVTDIAFSGAAQVMTRSGNSFSPVGSAYLAWSEFRSSGTESYPALFLSCAQQPGIASAWNRSIDVSPIPWTDRNNNERPRAVATSINRATFVVALQTDRDRVFIGSLSNSSCQSAPSAPAWLETISNATLIDVALGEDGTLWRSWLDRSTSNVIIAH